ncbi:hypothetical protein MVES_002007 [Malassezia vespertilionis]|uniref:Kinesin-like protein n=1 Tax=Malassezia vespertilionis TaxID=2020962 RepID=A0A2N1JC75_9BASI|nr:hypothetical protein MVES_002007 [Malassezia vespertilionis]
MSGMRTPSASSIARLTELGVSSEPIQKEPVFGIQVVSDTEVVMTPPRVQTSLSARSTARERLHAAATPSKYTFSKVFHGEQGAPDQSAFFAHTTLGLVRDLLDGKNSLVFTYGVTNSGKTYTVQGKDGAGQAGILPRAIDVVFNSIQGKECTSKVRPVGLNGVHPGVSDSIHTLFSAHPAERKPRPQTPRPPSVTDLEVDRTKLETSGAFRYSVWLSYVEVYNEKLYDLLCMPNAGAACDEHVAQRRPLVLKSEVESGGKYVGGLKEIKVSNIAEARELLRRGQENRTVFSTMANRVSSRSHSVFTIKLLREQVDVDLAQGDVLGLSRKFFVSRLSIVDLAGSERVANTDNAIGLRLKEAGNINKSLMCLGQCLETMRKNQIRAGLFAGEQREQSVAEALPKAPRRQSIIPFRHSKLTELFQSFFTGDGKVVMIVNLNPFGTQFDENTNVMRFSAMAKDVGIHVAQDAQPAFSTTEHALHSETLEESDEEEDTFVTMLVEENSRLRHRAERAESLCLVIEKSVRDEMAQYMEAALRKMQRYYDAQLRTEMNENDDFLNRKIDLFARLSASSHASPVKGVLLDTENNAQQTYAHEPPETPRPLHPIPNSTPRHSVADKSAADESHDLLFQPVAVGSPKSSRRLRKKAAIQSDEIDAHVAHQEKYLLRRSARLSLR